MGVIDQITHIVECVCGKRETVTILQRGSAYGGTWQSGRDMKEFRVTWGPSKFHGPEILDAICISCGEKATAKIS